MLFKITTKHASNSHVTFVTYKRFVVLFSLTRFWATRVEEGLFPLMYIDVSKFVLLSIFTLIETKSPKMSVKPLSKNAKSSLPVDVPRCKTSLLKLADTWMTTSFPVLPCSRSRRLRREALRTRLLRWGPRLSGPWERWPSHPIDFYVTTENDSGTMGSNRLIAGYCLIQVWLDFILGLRMVMLSRLHMCLCYAVGSFASFCSGAGELFWEESNT